MKATGMESAGGVGKITADWIVNGEPRRNVWDVDIRRFLGLHNNRLFLRDRMVEVPGLYKCLNLRLFCPLNFYIFFGIVFCKINTSLTIFY